MIVVIFIENESNEFLIKKRTIAKGGKWVSVKEIDSLMEKGEFNKVHYMMFKDCLKYLNK